MPIGDIAGELLGTVARFVGRFFGEMLFEVGIKGVGYSICRRFSPSVDPDGIAVSAVGITAWALLVLLILAAYRWIL